MAAGLHSHKNIIRSFIYTSSTYFLLLYHQLPSFTSDFVDFDDHFEAIAKLFRYKQSNKRRLYNTITLFLDFDYKMVADRFVSWYYNYMKKGE